MKRILLLIAIFYIPQTAFGEEQCLKKVLHIYCLGGSVQKLIKAKRPIVVDNRTPPIQKISYLSGNNIVTITGYKNRISAVSIIYDPSTTDIYNKIHSRLEKEYGKAKSSKDLRKKDTKHIWYQKRWRIVLGWPGKYISTDIFS